MLDTAPSNIIFDHTVLNTLALVQASDVITRLYPDRAFICNLTFRVAKRRIDRHQPCSLPERFGARAIYRAVAEEWLQVVSHDVDPIEPTTELLLAHKYSQHFCHRQAESLAIAHHRHWVLASDHPSIKTFAQDQGIRVTGSLGILIKAVKAKILSLPEADSIHTYIVSHGYNSPLSPVGGVSSFLTVNTN